MRVFPPRRESRWTTKNRNAGLSGTAMTKRRRPSDKGSEEFSEQNDDEESEPLIQAKLPGFLAEAFGELYHEDGLLVLGKGLGILRLMAAFVRFYADVEDGHVSLLLEEQRGTKPESNLTAPVRPVKAPLVFVLGLREAERTALVNILQQWGMPPELLPTLVTNESGQGKDRADLLTNVASPKDIDGVLVGHAESVTEQSTEAFILRIYKAQKQWSSSENPGFVKAFSDAPESLMAGFAKVDKILKSLHVQRLYLYPRFHASVSDELELSPPYVEELHQELTPKMKEIQGAIAAAVQTCIRELKRSTALIEWTDSELTVENIVSTNFDMTISRQLEHDWHRLKPQTKQLVNDLRTLRSLFQYLIHYDCVSFWKLINSIRTMSAASRNPSMWLLTPAADLLFRKAKERIYTMTLPRPTSKIPNPIAKLVPVLEENPKWRLLRQVLSEVKRDWRDRLEYKREMAPNNDVNFGGGAVVLVMVKDEKALDTVQSYLSDEPGRTMALRWLRYLEHFNDRSRGVTKAAGGTSSISEESRLLLEEEGRARNFLFRRSEKSSAKTDMRENARKDEPLNAVPGYMRKRRKIASERSRGAQNLQSDDLNARAILDEAVEATEHYLDEMEQDDGESSSSSGDEDELLFKVSTIPDLRIVIRNYSSIENEQSSLLLDELKPEYVVLYDANPSFIRALEMFSNSISNGILPDEKGVRKSKHAQLRVFFMLFEASSEENNFLKSLEKEQNAFERLIQHKKTMPLPINTVGGMTQEMQLARGGVGGTYAGETLPLSMDTRTGRGKQSTQKERRDIAVDVREFRSALPSILHLGGMRLAPATLTVGDFVLSNVHCVERKSISDLFGSFASGRLFTQAESMSKYYKCPCLLIEFDPGKTFSLQNVNELGGDIKTDSICSKMALLVMHFPKLRLLWSRSPHETLKIFKALKTNHEEVDVEKAIELGSNESVDALLAGDGGEEDGEENEINEAARDMLLRLPGVNVHHARKIMSACDSIADLANMSREEMKKLVGPVTGQKLFTFFRQKLGST